MKQRKAKHLCKGTSTNHSFSGISIEAITDATQIAEVTGATLHTYGIRKIPHMGMVRKEKPNSRIVIHPRTNRNHLGINSQYVGSHLYRMASFVRVDFGTISESLFVATLEPVFPVIASKDTM